MIWLAVAIGGALGAMARYGLTSYLLPVGVKQFPWGTLTANVLGSILMGMCYILIMEKHWVTDHLFSEHFLEYWRPLIMTGFLGAFTTYSAFALESFLLWQQGLTTMAITYAVSSLIGCLLAITISIWLTAKLLH